MRNVEPIVHVPRPDGGAHSHPAGSGAQRTQRGPAHSASVCGQVSIVVPFLDERDNLPALIDELRGTLAGVAASVEVVLVDDGSTDGSADVARVLVGSDPRFRLVRLRGNQGKSAAIAAGRDHSRGDVVVTMDADLQDSPAALPRLLAKLDEGYDLVTAWRQNRKDPLHRRAFACIFNRFTTVLAGVPIHDVNSGFKAYRRQVLEAIHLSPGMHRFTAILAHGFGYRVGEVEVEHRKRRSGRTKFGPWRYAEAALGLLAALYVRRVERSPMATLGSVGMWLLVASVAAVSCVVLMPTPRVRLWGGVVSGVLGLIGLQMLITAIAVELALQRRGAAHAAGYRLRSDGEPLGWRADGSTAAQPAGPPPLHRDGGAPAP